MGTPLPPPKGAEPPQFSALVYCVAKLCKPEGLVIANYFAAGTVRSIAISVGLTVCLFDRISEQELIKRWEGSGVSI